MRYSNGVSRIHIAEIEIVKDKFGYELTIGDRVFWYYSSSKSIGEIGVITEEKVDDRGVRYIVIMWGDIPDTFHPSTGDTEHHIIKSGTPEHSLLLLKT